MSMGSHKAASLASVGVAAAARRCASSLRSTSSIFRAGGAFSHSTDIILLDRDGVIRARTSSLAQLDKDFMRSLVQAVN